MTSHSISKAGAMAAAPMTVGRDWSSNILGNFASHDSKMASNSAVCNKIKRDSLSPRWFGTHLGNVELADVLERPSPCQGASEVPMAKFFARYCDGRATARRA